VLATLALQDKGSAMKGATMLATLEKLGVVPSFSRPRVSNDNPFAESLFRRTATFTLTCAKRIPKTDTVTVATFSPSTLPKGPELVCVVLNLTPQIRQTRLTKL
jgi:transposase InsO family protein